MEDNMAKRSYKKRKQPVKKTKKTASKIDLTVICSTNWNICNRNKISM